MPIRKKGFPESTEILEAAAAVVTAFEEVEGEISSFSNKHAGDLVLRKLAPGLERRKFKVELGKKKRERLPSTGHLVDDAGKTKIFYPDACCETSPGRRFVLEVEAGRAVDNHAFLRDLFAACISADVDYLAIAVRQDYRKHNDYERVIRFFDSLHASGRLKLPLKGTLIIGY